MENIVYIKDYSAPPVDRRQILRYAGVSADGGGTYDLISECLDEAQGVLSYRVCYREFPILRVGDGLDIGFCRTDSRSLLKNLQGCDRIILFAATVGLGIDRLIKRYGATSPTRAMLLEAIGSERVESLCELFNSEIAKNMRREGRFVRPRFSPGYGDLSLALQREVFAALDCHRRLGLTLNASLLMSPSKSVTAIIGIGTEKKRITEKK